MQTLLDPPTPMLSLYASGRSGKKVTALENFGTLKVIFLILSKYSQNFILVVLYMSWDFTEKRCGILWEYGRFSGIFLV